MNRMAIPLRYIAAGELFVEDVLKAIEQDGFYQDCKRKIYINQIPVPNSERYRGGGLLNKNSELQSVQLLIQGFFYRLIMCQEKRINYETKNRNT